MKTIKRIIAVILVLALGICLVACHPKDETAVSLGDIKITSAMYSYYLMMADMEAQNRVSESGVDMTAKNFDIYKQEIDGKKYVDFVEELALNNCKKAIAYMKLCKDAGLTLDDVSISNASQTAMYYWYYSGYSSILPLNGINYETFVEINKINYYGDIYFKHLYDKGGDKEIPEADIMSTMEENFVAAYLIQKQYTDATLEEIKTKFQGYKERLEKGEDFKTVKEEFEKSEQPEDTTSSTTTSSGDASSNTSSNTSSTTTSSDASSTVTSSDTSSNTSSGATSSEDDTPKAKDELIQIKGSKETEDSGYYFAKFDDLKAMALDEVKLIEDTENKVLYLAIKKDIKADSYYREELLESTLLYLIKGDEFEEMIKTYTLELEVEVNKFAIGQFKVKKINYGTAQ